MNEKNNKSDSAYQVSEGQSQDSAKLGAVTMAYNRGNNASCFLFI